jgi:predicted DCC family thiol-disulfide oxidoreductase YuxK
MIPIAMASRSYPWTLLYDADCGLCKWSLSLVLKLDRRRRLRPLALQSAEANQLLADLSPDERSDSWHLVSRDGRRWSAGAAAPPLLRLLPGGRLPARLLDAAPGITERAYRFVADHRSLLGRALTARSKERAAARIEAAQRKRDTGL